MWWARQDSNLQPDRYERPALTIELTLRNAQLERFQWISRGWKLSQYLVTLSQLLLDGPAGAGRRLRVRV